jgi:hypothetical protein
MGPTTFQKDTLAEVLFTLTEVSLNLTEVFLTLTEVFPYFFHSCKANARVKLAKTGHGPHSSTLVVICVVWFYLCCSIYCLCVNVYCHRVSTQLNLLTPWSRVLLEKLTVNFAASQEILRIYGTRKFLTVPTKARYQRKHLYMGNF